MVTTSSDLKDKGLKVTLPRLRIIRLFEKAPERHLSAEDIYRKLSAEKIDTGLATIYRVLTQFEQVGLLLRHHFESDKAVYELNRGLHHDHIVCICCGRIAEFSDPDIEKRQESIAEQQGFSIVNHTMTLYGYCTSGECAKAREEEQGSGNRDQE